MEKIVELAREKIEEEIEKAKKNKIKFITENKQYIEPLVNLSKKAFLKIQPTPEEKIETKKRKIRAAKAKKNKVFEDRLNKILDSSKAKAYKNKKA